jgi:molybdenum ABC transporter molybdate-binding protein
MEAPVEPRTLTVLAAASLTDAFTEIGKNFEAANPGVAVEFSFAGSQQLAQQLGQGVEADVFASANKKQMDVAIEANRVNQNGASTFVRNRLVVIVPKENPAGLKELKDLAKTGVKLDLADKAVPVGHYSLDFLDKAVEDPAFGAAYKDGVLANVVSYEENVKAVVTKVLLNEVDAGIVYLTDITPAAAEKVDRIDIPDALNTIAAYPIAPVSDSKNADLARGFVDYVLSEEGQHVMARHGFIPASGSDSTASNPITVTDALGRTVTFEQAPTRIVLAGKALFMIADAIYLFPEAGRNIVALGSTAQGSGNFVPLIDPAFSEKISLEKDAGPEQIAAAQPDCVIMKSSNAESLGTPLEALNIPVVYLDFETAEQYKRDLATLGQLFNNPARAEKLAAYFQSKVETVATAISGLNEDQKPRTLLLYYNEKDGSVAFNVPPLGWMQTYLVETAGGLPVWKDAELTKSWTKVSLEQVAAWKPDIIFVVAYFNPVIEVVEGLKSDPQWANIDAVKNNKIFGFAGDLYSWDQPDPRWVLGLDWVAATLHPELFPNYDIVKDAQAFYTDLYGMGDAAFKSDVQPAIIGAGN